MSLWETIKYPCKNNVAFYKRIFLIDGILDGYLADILE